MASKRAIATKRATASTLTKEANRLLREADRAVLESVQRKSATWLDDNVESLVAGENAELKIRVGSICSRLIDPALRAMNPTKTDITSNGKTLQAPVINVLPADLGSADAIQTALTNMDKEK